MKLVSYNILCGGNPQFGSASRLDDIVQVLRDLAPDVVALQEANGFHDARVRARFTDALALPHWALAEGAPYEDGERYHTVLLSRYALVAPHAFPGRPFQSAALSATADTPLGTVEICSLHLHAYDEDERLGEIDHVLANVGRHPGRIMAGDFNALDPAEAALRGATGRDAARHDVIDRMTAGHVDVFHRLDAMPPATYPTGLDADHEPTPPRRIDYVFATPDVAERVTSAALIDTPLTRRASDHFPLLVTFDDRR